MHPNRLFQFCPRCGRSLPSPGENPLSCPACGFSFFFNPTVAAAAYLYNPAGEYLFIRRAKDPAIGKLAIPGGFIDIGESAEEALARETLEEVGLEIDSIEFLGSTPNNYPYRDVTYPVVDLIFRARAVNPGMALPLDAVAGLEWRRLSEIDPDELAFPSLRMGLERLLTRGY